MDFFVNLPGQIRVIKEKKGKKENAVNTVSNKEKVGNVKKHKAKLFCTLKNIKTLEVWGGKIDIIGFSHTSGSWK